MYYYDIDYFLCFLLGYRKSKKSLTHFEYALTPLSNGISSSDPLSGKLFDTGLVNPKGYAEFVASNLNPGKYPYYSIKDPSLKCEIIVISEK